MSCENEGDIACQVSIPAKLRREMQLLPGATVHWVRVPKNGCRLVVEPEIIRKAEPLAAIGFAQRHGLPDHSTEEWMKILREDEGS